MVDDSASSLALPPPIPAPITSKEPPRGHRSDTIGIFTVLALAGVANLVPRDPGSVRELVDPRVAVAWSLTLVVFGTLGLVSTLLPTRMTIPALGLEMSARIALTFGASTYATAILLGRGWTAGTALASCVFYGIGLLCAFAAVEIARWLVQQRRAVERVLTYKAACEGDSCSD